MNNLKIESDRLVAIDYLKAIAIISVIITHTYVSKDANAALLLIGRPFWIDMAVPVFMILSGFTNSFSSDRRNINNLRQWFVWNNIYHKLIRILFPYAIILLIETIAYTLFAPRTLKELLYGYCTGGWGPGSYYIAILIQLLVLFPILLILFKKSPAMALILTFAAHLIFDILSNTIPFPGWLYRLSIFRYLVFIIMGIMLYYYREKIIERKLLIIILMVLSALYIWVCNYNGYVPFIFTKWTVTSLPTVFWAFGLVLFGFKYLNIMKNNFFTKAFSTVGKASFHIFLTQMVYFGFSLGQFGLLLNLLICIIGGITFYFIELWILKWLKTKQKTSCVV